MLYHGLSTGLSEQQRCRSSSDGPGLRVNVLLALRDDALAELDDFAGRIPDLFSNLLRLDRLDRDAGRAAILGPLARYSELAGESFTAEDALVEAVLDEASTDAGVEAPYLQLVLERLWERERESGSRELRLETLRAIGGARAVVREHVQGALDAVPARRPGSGGARGSAARHAVGTQGLARAVRPRGVRGRRGRRAAEAARHARSRADRPRRQRHAGRADALRDLPRRARTADPRVAGRAPAAA